MSTGIGLKSAFEVATDRLNEERDSDEASRLERRRRLRERIATCDIASERADYYAGQVAELENRKAVAKLERNKVVIPAEARLKEIEAAIATAAGNRQPVDPALKAEQLELLGVIREAAETLKKAEIEADALMEPLLVEQNKFRREGAEAVILKNEMCRPPYANPQWFAEHHGWSEAETAMARIHGAQQEKVADFRRHVEHAKRQRNSDVEAIERAFNRQSAIASALGRLRVIAGEKTEELWKRLTNE
jgi:hypothetical protein